MELYRIDPILHHKSALNWNKKTEIISCIFSDHNTIKLEINPKKKIGNPSNTSSLKKILLKNEWVSQEIKGKFLKNPW